MNVDTSPPSWRPLFSLLTKRQLTHRIHSLPKPKPAFTTPSPLSLSLCMELNHSSTSSNTFRDDFPFHPGTFLENCPQKPWRGFSIDLEAPPPPPSNVNGLFYKLLHSHNTDILNDDHGFSVEGSSSNPFSRVVSIPQLDPPFHHPSANPHPTISFPRGFDLCMAPPAPTPPSLPPSVKTSPESGDNGNGTATHGQVEFKSLFNYGPVNHLRHCDPVTVDCQIMPLLDLNEPPLLNERLGEEISSGGMNSDCQWGHEWNGNCDDRSKREVVIGLPLQQKKQTTGKKKRESEDGKVDKEPLVVKGQWTVEEDTLRLEQDSPFFLASSSSSNFFPLLVLIFFF